MSSNTRRRTQAARSRPAAPPAATAGAPAQAPLPPATAVPAPAQPSAGSAKYHLDAVANEAIRARFTFDIPYLTGERVWSFRAPEELNWLDHALAVQLAAMDDLRPFLREVLGEQYADFVKLTLSVGQVWSLINDWQRHYGIALPESSASRRS